MQHEFPNVSGNAGCMVIKQGRLLLVKMCRTEGWGLPGGKPESGETADQTAARETLEETGLKVKIAQYLGNYHNQFHIYHGQLQHPVESFLLPVPQGVLNEIIAVEFRDLEALSPEEFAFPQALPLVKSLLKQLRR